MHEPERKVSIKITIHFYDFQFPRNIAKPANRCRAQGVEQGLQQGMQREAQIILMRLLQKRFGILSEETHTRVHNATLEQLTLWTDKILDAPTLPAIFGDH